jgi:hypothetical protein
MKNFKDRLFSVRLKKDEKNTTLGFLVIGVILIIIAVNMIQINSSLSKNKNTIQEKQSGNIKSAISSTTNTVVESKATSTTVVSSGLSVNQNVNTGLIKDYFIPLGSGVAQSDDWQDVVGALATTNLAQYPSIKEIRFEVSINVPTGNEIVWVRLFNKDDQHPVWYSEVKAESNANSYLISSPIVYDFGQKTYQVQMKTQLKAPANLVQSRIHVILK